LERALQGHANAISQLATAEQPELLGVERSIGVPLVVKRSAVVDILHGLTDGRFSISAAQSWASFMRRGFAEDAAVAPTQPIDIEFEHAWEDAISATISWLDDIGDTVDGEVSTVETLDLMQLLGER
jgi:hypothetical protein